MTGFASSYASVLNGNSDDLLLKHAPLVKKIAYHVHGRLPDHVQIEDLIQAGMIGLIDAARNFDGTKGASFETYAGIRVRGAMIDEVRTNDWTPRSVSRNLREMAEAIRKAENRLGAPPGDTEIAAEMGISLAEYQKMAREASFARVFSLDEMENDENHPNFDVEDPTIGPAQMFAEEDFRKALVDAIKHLPEREALVMSLYYEEELNLREIGEILGVSESRVSQIHGQTLARLKSNLAEWIN